MGKSPSASAGYQFPADEDDVFDENLDRFDNQQFGEFEDGIGLSEIEDENELEDGEDSLISDEDEVVFQREKKIDPEMDDYDDLED